MNLKSVVCVAACLGFFVTGCGRKPTDSGAVSAAKGKGETVSDEAIPFHNALLEFRKLATAPLKKTLATSKDSKSWIEREGIPGEKPMWKMVLIGINPFEKLAKTNIVAPKSFSKEDRAFFDSRIQTLKETTAQLNTIIHSLEKYYAAEDYKDDKHKKFLDLEAKIQKLADQIGSASEELGSRSHVLASAAERKALEKDPLGIFIITMRDLNEKAGDQVHMLADDRLLRVGSGTSFTDESKAEDAAKVKDLADAAEAFSKEIAAMLADANKVDLGVLEKKPILRNAYKSYLEEVENQQGEIRKTVRHIREWGNIGNQSDINRVIKTVENLWGAHNNFIKSANKTN